MDRIIAALPTGNPNLTNRQAFYVALRTPPTPNRVLKLAENYA